MEELDGWDVVRALRKFAKAEGREKAKVILGELSGQRSLSLMASRSTQKQLAAVMKAIGK